jgi:hypothetical protein
VSTEFLTLVAAIDNNAVSTLNQTRSDLLGRSLESPVLSWDSSRPYEGDLHDEAVSFAMTVTEVLLFPMTVL